MNERIEIERDRNIPGAKREKRNGGIDEYLEEEGSDGEEREGNTVGKDGERKRVEDCRNEENDESLAVEKRRHHGKCSKPELGFTREDEANYRKKKKKVVGLSFFSHAKLILSIPSRE